MKKKNKKYTEIKLGISLLAGAVVVFAAGLYSSIHSDFVVPELSFSQNPSVAGVKIASSQNNISSADFEYLGAFRLPQGSSYTYAGSAMTYYPDGDPSGSGDGYSGSLYVSSHTYDDEIGEISIPAPSIAAVQSQDYNSLPVATALQSFSDITYSNTRGSLLLDYFQNSGLVSLGDLLYLPAKGVQSEGTILWNYLDNYNVAAEDFDVFGWSSLDLSSPNAQGTWHVGVHPPAGDSVFHSVKTWDYMTEIPQSWASANVNGQYIATGNFRRGSGGWLGGPTIYSFELTSDGNPPSPESDENLNNGAELEATALLYYPYDGDNAANAAVSFPNYCADDGWSGLAWVEAGSESGVLLIGNKGRGESCYKESCAAYCGGNEGGYHCSEGWYPAIAFYDPDDLASVAQGVIDPWEVQPYDVWDITDYLWPVCQGGINGVAYDKQNNRLYIAQNILTNGNNIIHIFQIASNGDAPEDPPASVCGNGSIESGEACDDGDSSSGDGCSSACQVESGYTCSGEPSSCSVVISTPTVPSNCAALPASSGTVVNVSSVSQLTDAVNNASANTVIKIANGTYNMGGTALVVSAPNVSIRSSSGNRDSVIIDGQYQGGNIITVNSPGVTIADITLKRSVWHPIQIKGPANNALLYNLSIIDGGQQYLKVTEDSGEYADSGTLACSYFDMTSAGRSYVESQGSCYTGGVDAHTVQDWEVYDNTIKNIYCNNGYDAEHGIHFWKDSRDTLVERNTLINNARGIGFGLGSGSTSYRTYSDNPLSGSGLSMTQVDNIGGVIRNNMVFGLTSTNFDTGIGLEASYNTDIYHNTVYSNNSGALGIDLRYTGTQSINLANNLYSPGLSTRNSASSPSQNVDNVTATSGMFVNASTGDLHILSSATSLISQGTNVGVSLDIDRDSRDSTPDIGADEYTGESVDPYCGDGNIDSGEQCDGSNFDGLACSNYGYSQGSLSCSNSCQIDTVGCYNPASPSNPNGGPGGGGGGALGSVDSNSGSTDTNTQGINTGSAGNHPDKGRLIALRNVQGAAVYRIGGDGKKYVFPDANTYFTWYDNFNAVEKIDVAVLDQYPDGGAMPYRAGTELITHQDTAKIYAVGKNGVIHWIQDEATAERLFGSRWRNRVRDVIPGFFSVTYVLGLNLDSQSPHPEGSLVQEGLNIYYIQNGQKRLFSNIEAFFANGFNTNHVVVVDDLSAYPSGSVISGFEESLFY